MLNRMINQGPNFENNFMNKRTRNYQSSTPRSGRKKSVPVGFYGYAGTQNTLPIINSAPIESNISNSIILSGSFNQIIPFR